jgi:hypothetical protein
MANWACTDYAIEGSKESLHKIYNAIMNPDIEEDSDKSWEGNVLRALDITWERDLKNIRGKYMRGFIRDAECIEFNVEKDDNLRFWAEEAWGLTDFYVALEEKFPDIKVYWIVEEIDGDVFATNDKEGKYFSTRFFVDTCIEGDYQSDYFTSEESVYKWLSDITDGKVTNEKEVNAFNDKHEEAETDEENFIYIHKYSIEN